MDMIYTLAYGDASKTQAELLVKSLRRFAKFDGDIHVISERPWSVEGAHTIVYPEGFMLCQPNFGKIHLGCVMDVTVYRRVMWLDSDVLALGPLDRMFAHPGTGLAYEYNAPARYEAKGPFNMPGLPLQPGEQGFNSGILVADACDWNGICRTIWNRLVQVKGGNANWPHDYYEQPTINVLAKTGVLKVNPFPIDWVAFFCPGVDLLPSAQLVHVLMPPNVKERIMRILYGLADIINSQREQLAALSQQVVPVRAEPDAPPSSAQTEPAPPGERTAS